MVNFKPRINLLLSLILQISTVDMAYATSTRELTWQCIKQINTEYLNDINNTIDEAHQKYGKQYQAVKQGKITYTEFYAEAERKEKQEKGDQWMGYNDALNLLSDGEMAYFEAKDVEAYFDLLDVKNYTSHKVNMLGYENDTYFYFESKVPLQSQSIHFFLTLRGNELVFIRNNTILQKVDLSKAQTDIVWDESKLTFPSMLDSPPRLLIKPDSKFKHTRKHAIDFESDFLYYSANTKNIFPEKDTIHCRSINQRSHQELYNILRKKIPCQNEKGTYQCSDG